MNASGPGTAATVRRFHQEAGIYLRGIEARCHPAGLKVQIVMSTDRCSGIMRLLCGSVAEAVLRGTHSPRMLAPIAGREELENGWSLH